MKKQNGFTLIELLVVITIIGVLSAIGLASYKVANQKARDAKRNADIQTIQSALEVYRSRNDQYPDNISDATLGSYVTSGKVPTDPNASLSGCAYSYIPSADRYSYTMTYCLESDPNHPITVKSP